MPERARLPKGTSGQVYVYDPTAFPIVNDGWKNVSAILPAGIILAYGGTAAPAGWLLCDGAVVSRTTYAVLFAVVGTAYNTGGEPGTDFRLPDMRGRFPLGKAAAGTGSTLGGSGGAIDHVHTADGTLAAASDGAHTHDVGTLDTANESTHTHTADGTLAAASDGAHTHGPGSYQVTVPADPVLLGVGATEVGAEGAVAVTGTSDSGGAHTHDVTGNTSAGSAHKHAVTGATASGGAHTHDVTGSTSSQNPPYQVHNYIINTGV